MRIGILYGGQGSQQVGMGKDLYEAYEGVRSFYDRFTAIRELSFYADIQTLSQTRNTQPCMVAFDIVMTDLLRQKGIVPSMTAGLSIGEYGALYCSEVLCAEDLIYLAQVRGKAMEEALEGKDTMMCALIGLSKRDVEELCESYSEEERTVQICNLNCPGQIVVGGDRQKVREMMQRIKSERMGKAIAIKVSGAFHTSYMKGAAEVLKRELQNISFRPMQLPIVWNLTGREKRAEESVSELLVQQVQSPVRFQASIEYMRKAGVDTFIEIGFGRVLEGFVRKLDEHCQIFSCSSCSDLEQISIHINGERTRGSEGW